MLEMKWVLMVVLNFGVGWICLVDSGIMLEMLLMMMLIMWFFMFSMIIMVKVL